MRHINVLLAVLTTLVFGPSATAQSWPSKPVTIVMPYAAGGPTDMVARQLADKLTAALGQPFLVVNAPGASTMIGAERVARAPSDGYTLLVGSVTTMSNNPFMYPNIRYKVSDFEPISMIARTPYTMSISPSLPAKTYEQFIAYAKQRPGHVFNATTGVGATNQLLGQMLNRLAGIDMVDVPYKGAGPALLDVMGGQVDLLFDGIATSAPAYRTGKIRILAVTSAHRLKAIPDVPTFAELGLPNMTSHFWYGMFAPAGTPKAIIERLNESINAALRIKDLNERLSGDGLTLDPGPPEALAKTIQHDAQVWGPLIKTLGISIN